MPFYFAQTQILKIGPQRKPLKFRAIQDLVFQSSSSFNPSYNVVCVSIYFNLPSCLMGGTLLFVNLRCVSYKQNVPLSLEY